MLQGRLTAVVAAAAALVVTLSACGSGASDTPIEDEVARPGITAIEEAKALNCSGDRATLEAAIEAYTLLNDQPPADEAALVEAGMIREESEAWDIVDGELVAQSESCAEGGVPMTAPATTLGEIVTQEEIITADEFMELLTDEDIAQVGGEQCARELAVIYEAGSRYQAEQGTSPDELADIQPYLSEPVTLWVTDPDDGAAPAEGSGCTNLNDL